ncbi:hypothetical protein ACLVWU_14395 [Bdellovibrio sp. HCB290]|uniref:hypothetical protein n=1 Tax=Bdellovibrio sp. HCB290 TaxID=3394356 RepID=UPI0039B6158C
MNKLTGLKYIKSIFQGLTILAALSVVTPALAANVTTSTTKAKRSTAVPASAQTSVAVASPAAPAKAWTLDLGIETYSNMMKEDSYERDAGTAFDVSAGYRFNKITSMRVGTALMKEHVGPENTYFDNTTVSISFKSPLTQDIAWINTIAGVLPTNRQMQDQMSYQGAARLGTKFAFNNLFWGSSASTAAQMTRNFHEYEMTADGSYNMRNNAQFVLTYALPLFSKLSLQTSYVYTIGWTYQDDTRNKFSVGADLGWEFTPAFSAYVGTSNEGNALKANGIDSNIEFFNDTTSIVKAGLSLSI